MYKQRVLVAIAALSCLAAAGGVLLAAATTVPATATFRDATTIDPGTDLVIPSDRIRSDGWVPSASYEGSQVGGNGFGFRSRTYGCTPAPRSVTLNFS